MSGFVRLPPEGRGVMVTNPGELLSKTSPDEWRDTRKLSDAKAMRPG